MSNLLYVVLDLIQNQGIVFPNAWRGPELQMKKNGSTSYIA